ncbi:MAG: hypothetical protein HOP31_01060 [Ignavibacteria bacterium]|nr:hypothetical protein [Ignavibacteria bacterium]
MNKLIIINELIVNSDHIVEILLKSENKEILVSYKMYDKVEDPSDVDYYTSMYETSEEAEKDYDRICDEINKAKKVNS